MFFGLRSYQFDGANFLLDQPRGGLLFSMGLGKTVTSLSVLSDDRSRLPALIVSPLRVTRVWQDEIEKWGFNFSSVVVHGKKRMEQMAQDVDIHITNPETLKHAVDYSKSIGRMPWRTVILDELTLFKSPKAARWKHARNLCRAADNTIGLTGSPISGTTVESIWGQVEVLAAKNMNPLGNQMQFWNRWFYFDRFNRPHPKKNAIEEIAELISPMFLRRSLDEIEMAELIEVEEHVSMNTAQKAAYADAEMSEVTSYSPMRTIASGFLYESHWSGRRDTTWLSEAKIDVLRSIVDETGDRILVFCNFRAEAKKLSEVFSAPVINGDTSLKKSNELIDQWNAHRLPMLIANATSLGHGSNLQQGGHRIVWYSLPDSAEIAAQANARLWRSGQKHSVVVHKIICQDSIDEMISELLETKTLNEQTLLAAVAAHRKVTSEKLSEKLPKTP